MSPSICLSLILCLLSVGCSESPQRQASIARPQNPIAPFPYSTESVRIQNTGADVVLAGTLSIPAGNSPVAAAILISGSGPQDRDETIAGHKPFLVLSDYLARRGTAVLRYDDRGVNESTGSFSEATIWDFATDATAAVEHLQSHSRIDSSRIGLIGHSEGGLVATIVATNSTSSIAYIAMLATPGTTGEQVFYLQDAAEARVLGIDETQIERSRIRKQTIFSILKEEKSEPIAGKRIRKALKELPLTPEEEAALAAEGVPIERLIDAQLRMLNNAATREFLRFDPVPALAQITLPVLAMTGALDVQVPADQHLPLIETALSTGKCPSFEVKKLPGLNHLFQTAETGITANYSKIQETFSPIALEAVNQWVVQVTTIR